MKNGDQLQDDLRKLEGWQSKWQMSFNPAKCKTICLSTKKVPPQRKYVCCEAELEQVDSISYLGVILNDNLKWSNHVSSISGKVSKVLDMKPLELPQESERNCIHSFCSAKVRIRLRGLGSVSPKGHKLPRKSTEESGAVLHKRLPPNCQCNRYDPGVGLANIGATEKIFPTYIAI